MTVLTISQINASECFITKENDQIIQKEGDCDERFAPCSTFKIALSLIGFDSGILMDETHPVWSFKEGYDDWLPVWKQDQTPKSWMTYSCVWYSQVLTQNLGMKKFQDYITQFNYGNQDLSGDKSKNNGLTHAWLSSSLAISSIEQITFLEKLINETLPVKPHAITMTKNLIFLETLKNGWNLYGKTGTGHVLKNDKSKIRDVYHGWFVGWIEKDNRKIIFASHITDSKKEENFPSIRAKERAKEKLEKIIDQSEK
ncbi:MAG: class D beta-lactamase [Proteobacteria bacterium]|nr:class D beta-lactamase [Pseudomonadota bacterium]